MNFTRKCKELRDMAQRLQTVTYIQKFKYFANLMLCGCCCCVTVYKIPLCRFSLQIAFPIKIVKIRECLSHLLKTVNHNRLHCLLSSYNLSLH